MHLHEIVPIQEPLRQIITQHYHIDETAYLEVLLERLNFNSVIESDIEDLAHLLVTTVRKKEESKKGIEALMTHYDLSTQEGIMLMCLAEALLRIPDKDTEHLLIRDKLTGAQWGNQLGHAESSFVSVATWGLALTGKLLNQDSQTTSFKKMWQTLIRRTSEPVVRKMVREAIRVMSEQFVLGRTIEEALQRSAEYTNKGYCFSYDMLGEAARTLQDADHYMRSYEHSIDAVGKTVDQRIPLFKRPNISVKLSALYPRYDFLHQEAARQVLTQRLLSLSLRAKACGICLTVDAEESDRLDLSLDIIEAVFCDPQLRDWDGLGLAVQAYQKRALSVLQWVAALARQQGKHICVRLVKGAYWDSEIKRAQELGHDNYPVFTRKIATDVNYLVCAKELLTSMQDVIYPQFATHNAYTAAAIISMIRRDKIGGSFEFQSLHGMGQALHDQLIEQDISCRVYAPVGSHEDLLPYLVRRLLENGANSSFVNQIADKNTPIEKLIQSPVRELKNVESKSNPNIPLPHAILGGNRINSSGVNYANYDALRALQTGMKPYWHAQYTATPLQRKMAQGDSCHTIMNPADGQQKVGSVVDASEQDVEQALSQGVVAFEQWNRMTLDDRIAILDRMADLLNEHDCELMVLVMREAGKVLTDAIAEIREAIDFCRYYATLAKTSLAPQQLTGYTGETNILQMRGRGVLLCISPWNFPVAIFTGQIAASLVAGNCVIAKPAEQTALTAAFVVDLFHKAGVPKEVLQLVPGRGETVGQQLVKDSRIAGVLFTGSTATAKAIQLELAQRQGPIVPFVAETGGINALIADSSALPEQLVSDVIASAFGSAGQRCSALRVLFIQEDIADKVIAMLQGAMKLLVVGNPCDLSTDVGPVIDRDAQKAINDHIAGMRDQAKLISNAKLSSDVSEHSTYVIPHAFELSSLDQLKTEIFGPVLHVVRYAKKDLDKVIDQINALGFGLTFGIHSRINETIQYIQSRVKAGNIYVNRTIIGAMVGVQPFGGSGLSGTGPKAGGPHYLLRLCEETTLTVNTTAAGGNASLMMQG